MVAKLVNLDDYRRKVSEWLFCLWCGHRSYREHVAGQRYSTCPKCDETASVPEWQLGVR